jgi:two-component system, response regulator PdtaR
MLSAEAVKTVLVVEDEDLVRDMTVLQLQDAGFDVLEASSAPEALEILESGATVALVFTDVNMPGDLDGLQLAARVRECWPQMRLIVTSGGGQVGPSHVLPPGRFIAKPYPLEALVKVVRQLTGDPIS